MPLYYNHHATIFVPAEIAAPLEVYRRAWDPVMAEQIAAHLTLVYPQKISGAGSLIEKLRNICPATASFKAEAWKTRVSRTPRGRRLRRS
jgi:hypothetical protein